MIQLLHIAVVHFAALGMLAAGFVPCAQSRQTSNSAHHAKKTCCCHEDGGCSTSGCCIRPSSPERSQPASESPSGTNPEGPKPAVLPVGGLQGDVHSASALERSEAGMPLLACTLQAQHTRLQP